MAHIGAQLKGSPWGRDYTRQLGPRRPWTSQYLGTRTWVSPGSVLLSDPGHHSGNHEDPKREVAPVLDAARHCVSELLPSATWPSPSFFRLFATRPCLHGSLVGKTICLGQNRVKRRGLVSGAN